MHKRNWLAILLALVLALGAMPMAMADETTPKGEANGIETPGGDGGPVMEVTESKDGETAPADTESKDGETAPADTESKDGETAPADTESKDGETAPADTESKDGETAPADTESKDGETAPADAENKDGETAPAEPTEPAAPKFTDVAATSPFAAAIDWAVAKEITLGKTETTFGPTDPCTVSHILTFLWRAGGKPGAEEGVADRDSAAKWALENEMIAEGADLTATCTRSMAVTFMWKAAGSTEVETEASFTDVAADADYAAAVAWAVENKITTGTTATTFAPDNNCNRGQIVTFLYRQLAEQEAAPAEGETTPAA